MPTAPSMMTPLWTDVRALVPRAAFLLMIAALLATSMSAQAAPAKTSDERRSLLDEGKRQRYAGDEAQALRSFQRAHALSPTPESFALMAASEYNLNKPEQAEPHLIEALRAPRDPWIARHRAELEKLLATLKSVLGWIEVTGSPVGTAVEVAGRPVGRLPLPGPLRVPAGIVNLRLAADGHKVARRDVEVRAEQTAHVIVDLAPELGTSAGPPASVPLSPPVAASVRGARSGYLTGGYVAAGVAVAFGATGVAALLVRQTSSKAFNQERNPLTGERRCNRALPDGAGGGPCQGYLDRADTATAASYVAFAGAGLAAIVSGILLSAGADETGSAAGDETRAALVPRLRACGPGLASTNLGAGCQFSF